MTNRFSGVYRISARKPTHRFSPISEDEAVHRQLLRDVMSILDFSDEKSSLRQGRRRFSDAFVALGTGGPRPGLFIPASDFFLNSVIRILLELKSTEDAGTQRMSQIDVWLAELGKANKSEAAGNGKERESAGNGKKSEAAGNGREDAPGAIIGINEAAMKISQQTTSAEENGPITSQRPDSISTIFTGSLALKHTSLGAGIPGDTKSVLEAIDFYENSVEELIASALSEKLPDAEAKLVAIELGKLINSSAYNYGATVEERAINRQTGLRAAEYYGQTYLDAPGQVLDFLENIRGYALRDEMREKGYDFWEGQAYESYKPHPLSIVWKRWERGGDRPFSQEAAKEFEAREKIVAETIANATTKVSDSDVSYTLESIKVKLGTIKDTAENSEEIEANIKLISDLNMLWVWYGSDF